MFLLGRKKEGEGVAGLLINLLQQIYSGQGIGIPNIIRIANKPVLTWITHQKFTNYAPK